MYIEPNSSVELFRKIPLDNTYENTLFFESYSDQNKFFTEWEQKISVGTNLYRVEPTKNSIKVQRKYEEIMIYSYMRFKNTSYENKWFYAFITKVEYVDNITSRIYYEIDVMQTWLPNEDYTLGQCFVEREHSETDNIGDNLVTESFNCNEYVINETYTNYLQGERFGGDFYVIVAVAEEGGEYAYEYDNVYSACTLYAFEYLTEGTLNEIKEFILSYSEHPEQILNVYTIPKEACDWIEDDSIIGRNHIIPSGTKGASIIWRPYSGLTQGVDTLDGYKPKNNKCYTYPFNYANVCTSNGDSLCVKYEYFKNEGSMIAPSFIIDTTITAPVQACLRPRYYKNSSSEPFLINKLVLNSYPVCAWSTDAYQAYLQNQRGKDIADTTVSTLVGVASILAGTALAATGVGTPHGIGTVVGGASMIVGGASSAVGSIHNAVHNNLLASTHDTQSSGLTNTSNVDFARGEYGFTFYRFSINKEAAEMIDDYFQMFGYACGKVKTPNIRVRKWWTYTKTRGCNLSVVLMPVEDKVKIQSIFDNGIRFFTNISLIGAYDIENPTL